MQNEGLTYEYFVLKYNWDILDIYFIMPQRNLKPQTSTGQTVERQNFPKEQVVPKSERGHLQWQEWDITLEEKSLFQCVAIYDFYTSDRF